MREAWVSLDLCVRACISVEKWREGQGAGGADRKHLTIP